MHRASLTNNITLIDDRLNKFSLSIDVNAWDRVAPCNEQWLLLYFSVCLWDGMTDLWIVYRHLIICGIKWQANWDGPCNSKAVGRIILVPPHQHALVATELTYSDENNCHACHVDDISVILKDVFQGASEQAFILNDPAKIDE